MKDNLDQCIDRFNSQEKCDEYRKLLGEREFEIYWKDTGGTIIRESEYHELIGNEEDYVTIQLCDWFGCDDEPEGQHRYTFAVFLYEDGDERGFSMFDTIEEAVVDYQKTCHTLIANNVIEAIKHDEEALLHASDEMKNDKNVVLEAIKQNSFAVNWMSPELKNDEDFILQVMKVNGRALEHVKDTFKSNKKIVLEAVKNYGEALWSVSDRLRNNRIIILEAVKQPKTWWELQYASERLRDDKEIVMIAVRKDGRALQWASERLKDDEEVVLEALKTHNWALAEASDRLRCDTVFLETCIEISPMCEACVNDILDDLQYSNGAGMGMR